MESLLGNGGAEEAAERRKQAHKYSNPDTYISLSLFQRYNRLLQEVFANQNDYVRLSDNAKQRLYHFMHRVLQHLPENGEVTDEMMNDAIRQEVENITY